MGKLRIMSSNVWYHETNLESWAKQGKDCTFAARSPLFLRMVKETLPDVIGFQEMGITLIKRLTIDSTKAGIPYVPIWGGCTSLMFRADKLDLVDSRFLIYPYRYEGLPESYNNSDTKCNLQAVFRVKETGKLFVFSNTHLWWKPGDPNKPWYLEGSDEARVKQFEMADAIASGFQEKYNAPIVFVGDLNTTYNTPPIKRAFELGYVHAHDVATEYAAEDNGYHSINDEGVFPYEPKPFTEAIDHILVKGAPEGFVRRFERFTPEWFNPASDHFPVWIDAEL